MAEVILKNIKKIYPHQEPKKKKKGEPEKKTNLQITEEGVLAVDNFNLHIQDKEFIVLVGPSGCGFSARVGDNTKAIEREAEGQRIVLFHVLTHKLVGGYSWHQVHNTFV